MSGMIIDGFTVVVVLWGAWFMRRCVHRCRDYMRGAWLAADHAERMRIGANADRIDKFTPTIPRRFPDTPRTRPGRHETE